MVETSTLFNHSFTILLKNCKPSFISFIQEKMKEIKRNSFYTFTDEYLFNHGLNSFGVIPSENNNKCIPYINCKEENIFELSFGNTKLSDTFVSQSKANKILAQRLISAMEKAFNNKILI